VENVGNPCREKELTARGVWAAEVDQTQGDCWNILSSNAWERRDGSWRRNEGERQESGLPTT